MKQYLFPLILSSLFISACSLSPTTKSPQDSQTTTPSTQEVSKKSLRDLLSAGVAQKCTWTFTGEDGQNSSGEIIFNVQKFRQNSVVQIDGKDVKSSVISDGSIVYIWNDDDKTAGIKMKVDQPTPSEDSQGISPQGIDWDQQYNYNCTPTTVSGADLTPPSDIKFTDMTELQNQMKNFNLDALKNLAPTE